ncbi:hypothetical protein BASA61_005761 [Batrachochytrium salamandrivorans]|nr:hypothetical protein BASA61_005761 [Batrachochytrium salamandrivorans]
MSPRMGLVSRGSPGTVMGVTPSRMSFMNRLNSNPDNGHPCLTPLCTGNGSDNSDPARARADEDVYNALRKARVRRGNPMFCSFHNSAPTETISNAFRISMNRTWVFSPEWVC